MSKSTGAAAGADSAVRVERRFLPLETSRSKLALALGLLGSGALGAGVYSAWLARGGVASLSSALLLGGSLAVLASFFAGIERARPLRVGELGVMLGEPPEARRVHWCEMDNIHVLGDELSLDTVAGPLRIPLALHAPAAARILAEASLRIPARVDVSPRAHERLPALSEAEGELVPAARLQLAGRKCAASGKSITFESDARLCTNCAALYHVDHVPAECLRCQRAMRRDQAAVA